MNSFPFRIKNITKKQCTDFGLVVIMLLLTWTIYRKNFVLVPLALGLTLITIVVPVVLYPFAFLWFGLSKWLGMVSSGILLTIIYYLVVTPVGVVRRLLGHDSLKLKEFKKGKQSVMKERNHVFTAADLRDTF